LSSGPNSSPLTLKIPAKTQRNSPSDFSATATNLLLSPQATLSSTIPTPATSSPTTEHPPTHSLQIPTIPSSPKSGNCPSNSFQNLSLRPMKSTKDSFHECKKSNRKIRNLS
jgi:hypothetical protein